MLSAAGIEAGEKRCSIVAVATPEGPRTLAVPFPALTTAEAAAWLRTVLRDLLSGPHAYFLPCEAALVRALTGAGQPLVRWLDDARRRLETEGPAALRSAYGPVPRPHEYPAPDADAAEAMVERRMGIFLRAYGAKS
jgi:hypothetical protein